MTLIYDTEIHQFMRRFAVTDIDELVVGETYYTNTHPESFVLAGLLTNAESYAKEGLTWDNIETANEIAWFEREDGQTHSLADCNVTEHPYNPWMIFKTVKERDACEALLKIEFDWYGED